jgi:hypothetical protein
MYQAVQFLPISGSPNFSVRATRQKPFKSFEAAKKSILKTGNDGYIKEYGQSRPIWNNLRVN